MWNKANILNRLDIKLSQGNDSSLFLIAYFPTTAKLARVKNSQVLSKNDVTDTIGYLILVCKEMGWETFDEFKVL